MEKLSIWYWDDLGMPQGCPRDASPATEAGQNARIWAKIKELGPIHVHMVPFELISNQNESYRVWEVSGMPPGL